MLTRYDNDLLWNDSQDYDFNYSDGDEANESGSTDLENMYYTAKCSSYNNA